MRVRTQFCLLDEYRKGEKEIANCFGREKENDDLRGIRCTHTCRCGISLDTRTQPVKYVGKSKTYNHDGNIYRPIIAKQRMVVLKAGVYQTTVRIV